MRMVHPDVRSRPEGFMIVFPDDTALIVFERGLDGAVECGKALCRLGYSQWTTDDGTLYYAGILDGHNYEQEVRHGWLVEEALQSMRQELHEEDEDEG